jgi:hypothetical protein
MACAHSSAAGTQLTLEENSELEINPATTTRLTSAPRKRGLRIKKNPDAQASGLGEAHQANCVKSLLLVFERKTDRWGTVKRLIPLQYQSKMRS